MIKATQTHWAKNFQNKDNYFQTQHGLQLKIYSKLIEFEASICQDSNRCFALK